MRKYTAKIVFEFEATDDLHARQVFETYVYPSVKMENTGCIKRRMTLNLHGSSENILLREKAKPMQIQVICRKLDCEHRNNCPHKNYHDFCDECIAFGETGCPGCRN